MAGLDVDTPLLHAYVMLLLQPGCGTHSLVARTALRSHQWRWRGTRPAGAARGSRGADTPSIRSHWHGCQRSPALPRGFRGLHCGDAANLIVPSSFQQSGR